MKTRPLSAELTYFRGRVALKAMLEALGVGRGGQVVIQAFTCLAVPEAVLATGALPVYADLARGTCNMAPASLEKAITPKVKAIVIQHTFGIPAPIDEILAIAELRKMPVIEDCCHTLASTYRGQLTGSFGVGSFYSFEWGKPLVAGLGGCAEINEPGLAHAMRESYRRCAEPGLGLQAMLELQYLGYRITYRPRSFWFVRKLFHKLSDLKMLVGNFDEMAVNQGGLLEPKLETIRMARLPRHRLKRGISRITAVTEHSRAISSIYREQISSRHVSHVTVGADCDVVYARYPLFTDFKKELLAEAERKNIEVAEWYSTPVHPLTRDELGQAGYAAGSCPEAESAAQRIVTLPTNMKVTTREAQRIAEFITTFAP